MKKIFAVFMMLILTSSYTSYASDLVSDDDVDYSAQDEKMRKARRFRDNREDKVEQKREKVKNVKDKIDTNNDGVVSKDEFMDAQAKRFAQFDKNNDGQLSKEELKDIHDNRKDRRQEGKGEKRENKSERRKERRENRRDKIVEIEKSESTEE